MKSKIAILSIGVFLIACLACGSASSVRELKSWVEEPKNGLVQKMNTDKYEFIAQYKPIDYIILNEIREETVDKSKYEQKKSELSGVAYFDFKIRRTDGQQIFADEMDNFKAMYLLDLMQQDFSLVIGKDTAACILYHSEASGTSTPYRTILLGFEMISQDKEIQDLTLVFDDQIFDSKQKVFTIQSQDIQSIPSLKIN